MAQRKEGERKPNWRRDDQRPPSSFDESISVSCEDGRPGSAILSDDGGAVANAPLAMEAAHQHVMIADERRPPVAPIDMSPSMDSISSIVSSRWSTGSGHNSSSSNSSSPHGPAMRMIDESNMMLMNQAPKLPKRRSSETTSTTAAATILAELSFGLVDYDSDHQEDVDARNDERVAGDDESLANQQQLSPEATKASSTSLTHGNVSSADRGGDHQDTAKIGDGDDESFSFFSDTEKDDHDDDDVDGREEVQLGSSSSRLVRFADEEGLPIENVRHFRRPPSARSATLSATTASGAAVTQGLQGNDEVDEV